MSRLARAALSILIIIGVAGVAAGCGGSGPARVTSSNRASSQGCAPLAGKQLIVLADDKKLQAVDNIVPAVQAAAASPVLLAALDRASATLTQDRLIGLNKATDIDRKTPKIAATEFAASVTLINGMEKGGSGRIIVGATSFNESQTLAFVYQIALSAAGFDATVQPVGTREVYESSLERGEIQIVPEYLGTLTEFLNKKVNGAGAATITSGDTGRTATALRDLGARVGLVFGTPAQAAEQNAFAVTKALADRYSLKTLSDFAAACSGRATVLGGPSECPARPFCRSGLEKTYGMKFGTFISLDAGGTLSKGALTAGTVSIALVFSADAALAG